MSEAKLSMTPRTRRIVEFSIVVVTMFAAQCAAVILKNGAIFEYSGAIAIVVSTVYWLFGFIARRRKRKDGHLY